MSGDEQATKHAIHAAHCAALEREAQALDYTACPGCGHGPLTPVGNVMRCRQCRSSYPQFVGRGGKPVGSGAPTPAQIAALLAAARAARGAEEESSD